MQKIDTTSLPAPDLVNNNWEFAEVWMDAMLSPPYILLLLGDKAGNCCIYNLRSCTKGKNRVSCQ